MTQTRNGSLGHAMARMWSGLSVSIFTPIHSGSRVGGIPQLHGEARNLMPSRLVYWGIKETHDPIRVLGHRLRPNTQ
jgi:hypothetical protein